MAHVNQNKARLVTRVRRLRGQLDALERALDGDADCMDVLTQAAAIRGASQGLMVELLGDHLRQHVVNEEDASVRDTEADQVLQLVKRYLG
ncbi:metal/formaldehyde-sensitive transcriptional repressor [Luteibacter aegosomatissinici]|uniref:metal/formaldehyde-sensitive transcriptional repressor n=1 Tax=Luteibacter aegosomatissinici TaxID=2911539 RepID=UPI001FF9B391|nr:metal/formaldehyde-sensitive transcriptional repressor [Luteibacter aegosomatissinici]UPG94602.1 metal/formaldehyde-sensitive transcriptional repressor [Luteibacter aegosomatissinici]